MQTTPTDKKLFSIKETAKMLGVSERTVWAVTAPRGRLISCKVGCRVLYSQNAIDRFIEHQEIESDNK
jgi:predicted DNA-binding transcriptional regulator AlpA